MMSALGFWPLFEYHNRCDEIARCRWARSKFPKCRQRNQYSCYENINSYMESIENRTSQTLQLFKRTLQTKQ